MTRVALIGVVEKSTPTPNSDTDHLRIDSREIIGLALPISADFDGDDEDHVAALASRQFSVLCHYAAEHDVVPIAFGSFFSNARMASQHLAGHNAELCNTLTKLKGKAEFTLDLKVNSPPQPRRPEPSPSGKSHLRERKAARDRRSRQTRGRQNALSRLYRELSEVSDAIVISQSQSENRLKMFNILMDRNSMNTCIAVLRRLQPEFDAMEIDMSLVGPGPAFSFSNGEHDGEIRV